MAYSKPNEIENAMICVLFCSNSFVPAGSVNRLSQVTQERAFACACACLLCEGVLVTSVMHECY